jgi:t-SNARE complex subunit (syntaxin)
MASVNQVVQKPAQVQAKPAIQSAKVVPEAAVVGEKKPFWKKWWLWVIALIIVAGIVIFLLI